MARTAPAPNIPPIPGMCPSIAVMGGGAGGGGGSGNGSGDGSGNGAENGDGSGDGANGDGRNAQSGSGQSGGQAGCPNHHGGSSSACIRRALITNRGIAVAAFKDVTGNGMGVTASRAPIATPATAPCRGEHPPSSNEAGRSLGSAGDVGGRRA